MGFEVSTEASKEAGKDASRTFADFEKRKTVDVIPALAETQISDNNADKQVDIDKRLDSSKSHESVASPGINLDKKINPNSKVEKPRNTTQESTDNDLNQNKLDRQANGLETHEVNGYKYVQDAAGRTVSAEGKLRIEPVERDKNAQLRAGGSERLETDDGGHLIGRQFGGIGEINLVAQDRSLNQGPYRELEQKWADAVKNGDTVYVKVEPVYKGDSIRPDSFRVSYSINGEKFKKVFSNKPNAYAK